MATLRLEDMTKRQRAITARNYGLNMTPARVALICKLWHAVKLRPVVAEHVEKALATYYANKGLEL